jgi:glycosyltransferase involved in cell wall biosynthesis/SAM-dependent methyltransferase
LTSESLNRLSVKYYGYVFDASGYGHAARAYIHALHSAGIDVSVVDLAERPAQVDDVLVASLLNRRAEPDFHIFHGIPPEWARLAFPLRNAVALTVWETDVMPTQWRNVLNHVVDVWLPCEFNVIAFRPRLESSLFKLPHPIFPPRTNGGVQDPAKFLRVGEQDFVFYSVFAWQERKTPAGLIEGFLRAFPAASDAKLIIKTNPTAASLAMQVLEATRQRVPSTARVDVRAEAWGEDQIAALHARGDCYVSLHRGEGWNYPLFEAASRGTPVVATGYSGPLEYLTPEQHNLVRYRLEPVRQPYVYYSPQMRWAEPDLEHAAELMQWVASHRDDARRTAREAAARIRQNFALETVGRAARHRLLQLLRRTQPKRFQQVARVELARELRPTVPIPGEWYDEEYFENGLKSNWEHGYRWPPFAGLFRETAQFLTSLFPDARSFLDAGCGKGFLVRALRECGSESWGFDASPWAIGHVEEAAQPFVTHASVDDYQFTRQFDLLLAFDLFSHVTEAQAVAFLTRARAWTRVAVVATIPTFPDPDAAARAATLDHDLSHITLHSRPWWHARLVEAGWQQDPLHGVVAQACQCHPLPVKMGWQMYLYAAGAPTPMARPE